MAKSNQTKKGKANTGKANTGKAKQINKWENKNKKETNTPVKSASINSEIVSMKTIDQTKKLNS